MYLSQWIYTMLVPDWNDMNTIRERFAGGSYNIVIEY